MTVDYATTDGTATAEDDYSSASGTLTFAPGETSGAISITVTDDAVHEPDETLTVSLSDATGRGVTADAEGAGTCCALSLRSGDGGRRVRRYRQRLGPR